MLAGGGDSDDEDTSSDSPSFRRSITRIWAHSRPQFTAQHTQAAADEEAGCVAAVAGRLGVADRGGASFATQLQVLLTRQVKVRQGLVVASAGGSSAHCLQL